MFGEKSDKEKIHYFEYIVNSILPFSDENKDKVFEPKFTTKSSGMGLGLAMVKNIVETYQGTITFTSVKDVGTTFTVSFPKEY